MSEACIAPVARLLGCQPPAPPAETAGDAHARGRAEAAAEAEAALQAAQRSWADRLREQERAAAAALAALDALFAEELAGLALAIAERVLATSALPEATVAALAAEALAGLQGLEPAELHCPPALAAALPGDLAATVVVDPGLPADSILACRGRRRQLAALSDRFEAISRDLADPQP